MFNFVDAFLENAACGVDTAGATSTVGVYTSMISWARYPVLLLFTGNMYTSYTTLDRERRALNYHLYANDPFISVDWYKEIGET